jgi:hypothetical protein
MNYRLKATIKRFFKVFISSAIAAMATITIGQAASWADIIPLLSNLALSGIIGGIAGVIAGAEKWLFWEDLP